MLKKAILSIIIALLLTIALLIVVIAMQPADFKFTRSATMAAAPEKVFEQVNDFHNWGAWSPWIKLDPNMKTSYSGPDSGPGATYAWSGNDEAGEGKMTIEDSVPTSYVKIALVFSRPFATANTTEFTVAPNGDKTDVAWTMSGKNTFLMKAVSLVVNVDKLIGGDFEKGLDQMKTIVESPPVK